jgi:NAD(P)-dependent dehydrogenase (short-subunit alcohol dehydrogenase family)
VTAAALRELARFWSPHLVILGRTPLDQDEPEWLEGLADEAAIRQALWDKAEEKPEPQELARAGARIMAGREVRTNLAALEKAGARVTYMPGDFEEEEFLKSVLVEIKRLYGPVHGFIHGAGVLADSLMFDKNESDFDRVFNTKARLARLILSELEGQPLNLVVFFSSSTARFGRRGQADYAAGNEYLNKLALRLAQNRPGPKCLSVNWGPWAGGMVNESLARLFQEEGVGLISLSEGARLFASLAGTPKHDPVEVVVLGRGTRLEGLAGGGSETAGVRG